MLDNENQTKIQEVYVLNEDEKKAAKDFIKGAVYCWMNINKEEPFSFRDLFGGDNREWTNTPLYPLWDKCRQKHPNDETAYQLAAQYAGRLLKIVLSEDKNRKFSSKKENQTTKYSWIKE